MTYRFIREDNGEVVEVDWETMMSKNPAGYITLEDGITAKEDRTGWKRRTVFSEAEVSSNERQCVSDALGFAAHQLEEFEADRKINGFSGIEFVRDEHTPEFIQVKGKAGPEWERYIRHRGLCDKNRHDSGVVLAPGELEKAIEIAKRTQN